MSPKPLIVASLVTAAVSAAQGPQAPVQAALPPQSLLIQWPWPIDSGFKRFVRADVNADAREDLFVLEGQRTALIASIATSASIVEVIPSGVGDIAVIDGDPGTPSILIATTSAGLEAAAFDPGALPGAPQFVRSTLLGAPWNTVRQLAAARDAAGVVRISGIAEGGAKLVAASYSGGAAQHDYTWISPSTLRRVEALDWFGNGTIVAAVHAGAGEVLLFDQLGPAGTADAASLAGFVARRPEPGSADQLVRLFPGSSDWSVKLLAAAGASGVVAAPFPGLQPAGIHCGDVDDDGAADLAISDATGHGLHFMFRAADGPEGPCFDSAELDVGDTSSAPPLLADLDRDGTVDCIVGLDGTLDCVLIETSLRQRLELGRQQLTVAPGILGLEPPIDYDPLAAGHPTATFRLETAGQPLDAPTHIQVTLYRGYWTSAGWNVGEDPVADLAYALSPEVTDGRHEIVVPMVDAPPGVDEWLDELHYFLEMRVVSLDGSGTILDAGPSHWAGFALQDPYKSNYLLHLLTLPRPPQEPARRIHKGGRTWIGGVTPILPPPPFTPQVPSTQPTPNGTTNSWSQE